MGLGTRNLGSYLSWAASSGCAPFHIHMLLVSAGAARWEVLPGSHLQAGFPGSRLEDLAQAGWPEQGPLSQRPEENILSGGI